MAKKYTSNKSRESVLVRSNYNYVLAIYFLILFISAALYYYDYNGKGAIYFAILYTESLIGVLFLAFYFINKHISETLSDISYSTNLYLDSQLDKRDKIYEKKILDRLSDELSLRSQFEAVEVPLGSIVIDTSSLIDGRILGLIKTNFLDGKIIIAQSVISELQTLADNGIKSKRSRGRRGLDILNEIREVLGDDRFIILDFKSTKTEVDEELVQICVDLQAKLVTVDYNLIKAAEVHNVKILNINQLVNKLKTDVLPDDILIIKIIREGKDKGQGIGYLNDGTMVIITGAEGFVNKEVEVIVDKVLQKDTGKIIFGKVLDLDSTEF